ncbi:hypothetical protein BpHYR1_028289 [Brachionus plicatilis]|uniref:Uncharacterized protein n=1 Tax=Brachionus plicatilis TaxID=10195 RepID=A0A3M7R9N1_BRAPC|nr:hypothetical protein BpHYR1_028289 [Brachionus plicatilis]
MKHVEAVKENNPSGHDNEQMSWLTYSPIVLPQSIRNRAPSRLYRASRSGSMPSRCEGVLANSALLKYQKGILGSELGDVRVGVFLLFYFLK